MFKYEEIRDSGFTSPYAETAAVDGEFRILAFLQDQRDQIMVSLAEEEAQALEGKGFEPAAMNGGAAYLVGVQSCHDDNVVEGFKAWLQEPA